MQAKEKQFHHWDIEPDLHLFTSQQLDDDYDPSEDDDYEPSDQEMMANFGTKWHDAL